MGHIIQDRLRETLAWFDSHIESTKKTESEIRKLLAESTSGELTVDQQLTTGRTCRELRECCGEAVRIAESLQAYHSRIGEVLDLAEELNLSREREQE